MKENFCVIDTETWGLSARPESFAFGCLLSDSEKLFFDDREKMVIFLLTQKKYKYVFAHNAEYDYSVLFDNIIINLDRASIFAGSLFIKAEKNGISFLNSLAVLKSSVKSLGEASGEYKLVLNDKFKNGIKSKITDEDIAYCFRDCEIIFNYLKKIYAMTGKVKSTIAGCAMKIFNSRFNDVKFKKNIFNEKFRKSYYGGRVECFFLGEVNPVYKYDVNSLYPYVCTKISFPDFSKIKKGTNLNVDFFVSQILENYEGCGFFKLYHIKKHSGLLPVKNEEEIIYPCGFIEGNYNFNEIRNGIKKGILKIISVEEYFYAPIFFYEGLKNYMNFFYELKNTTIGAEKLIYKFLLNSLTGKFGERDFTEKIYFENMNDCFLYIKENNLSKNEYQIIHFNEEREDVFLEVKKEKKYKPNWNIVGISSYITSYARIVMNEYYLANEKNIIYTDTDSIFLRKPLDKKFIGKNLGEMKKEDEDKVVIKGNKYYTSFIGEKKFEYIKGIKKEHDFKDGKFSFKKMIRTKESLRLQNVKAGEFITVQKVLKKHYTKRIVHKDGTTEIIEKKN